MYCYYIEKSEIQKKTKGPLKNGSHFENFWGCLQVFVLWGLAGVRRGGRFKLKNLPWKGMDIFWNNILQPYSRWHQTTYPIPD